MIEKIVCSNCGIERDVQHYYLSRIEGQKYMTICKDCFIKEWENSRGLEDVFKYYNIPYMIELLDTVSNNYYNNTYDQKYLMNKYMKNINSLPQYKNLKWKDSNFYLDEENQEDAVFYEGIINTLKTEAKILNEKLTKNKDNMNTYVATIKALRDILELIKKYDWQLQYSEYKTENGKEVAIWEQNNDGDVRNCKRWIVNDSECKNTKEIMMDIINQEVEKMTTKRNGYVY